MPEVLVVVHFPLFKEAGTLSNMRKIIELDAVPRVGDFIALPGRRELPIGRVRFRTDGHVSVHVENFAEILGQTTDGSRAGVAEMAEDFRAEGFTGITAWDED